MQSRDQPTTQDWHIPVVDISEINEDTGKAVVDAAASHGFLYITGENLGFDAAIIDRMFSLSRKFFSCTVQEKACCSHGASNMGWADMHSETLDPATQKCGDFKETFNFGPFVHRKAIQELPPILRAQEAHIDDFVSRCKELSTVLLQLFALGLEIQAPDRGVDWFAEKHDESQGTTGSILRWLHYPAVDSPSSVSHIRAGAHSDYGSLTLLFRQPGDEGLEVLTPASTWSRVPPFPKRTEPFLFPPILVNIGDLLQFWTRGVLRSTVHRVVFPVNCSSDRYSMAFFLHPLDSTEITTVPSRRCQGRDAGDGPGKLTAAEYLKARLQATYK